MPGAGLAGNRLFRVSVYLKGEEQKEKKKKHTQTHSPCYMYGDKIFFVIGFVHRGRHTLLCSLGRQTLSSCSTASDEALFFSPRSNKALLLNLQNLTIITRASPFPADGLGVFNQNT